LWVGGDVDGPVLACRQQYGVTAESQHGARRVSERRHSLASLGDGRTWQGVAAVVAVAFLSLVVVLAYVFHPQGPREFLDQFALAVNKDAYGPGLRNGERFLVRAKRAEAASMDSVAESLAWKAAKAFRRAAEVAAGPREELAANDRLADTYLGMGRGYLERGRGGRFGIGRRSEEVQRAEDVAACVVGIAPTQRRAEVNAFIEELERVLERPAAGRCPR